MATALRRATRSSIGQPITLNGAAYEVIGIAPAAINVLTPGDVWVPLIIDPGKEKRLNHVIYAIGRLKPGVSQAERRRRRWTASRARWASRIRKSRTGACAS